MDTDIITTITTTVAAGMDMIAIITKVISTIIKAVKFDFILDYNNNNNAYDNQAEVVEQGQGQVQGQAQGQSTTEAKQDNSNTTEIKPVEAENTEAKDKKEPRERKEKKKKTDDPEIKKEECLWTKDSVSYTEYLEKQKKKVESHQVKPEIKVDRNLIDPNLKEIVIQDEIIGYNQSESKKQTHQKAKKNEKKQELSVGKIKLKYIYFLDIKYLDASEKRNDNREERGGRGRGGRGRGNRGNYQGNQYQGYEKGNYQGNEGGYYQGNEGGYYY